MGYPPQGTPGILRTLLDANTIIKADADNTPEALTVAEQRLVGRITAGEIAALTQAQAEALLIDSRYGQTPFTFNYARVSGQGKPTLVNQGAFYGFSLPVFNSDDEELYGCSCVFTDWEGASDLTVYLGGWLTDANNAKRFKLQVSWESWTSGDDVPATTHDVEVETLAGAWNAKHSFKLGFTLDYDIDTPDNVAKGDALAIRIRRIAAASAEITGEVVIEGAVLYYQRGSWGTALG